MRLYRTAIWLAAFFSPKARAWIQGRRHWVAKLPDQANEKNKGHWIWIHTASLGEFEQGRPLIEALKEKHPDQPILLTFFSPSGYQIRKDYPLADRVMYLPMDTAGAARRFLDHFQPRLAVFVKYDLWHHYLKELDRRDIPVILISGLFREGQVYFRPFGGFFRQMLARVDFFFLQDRDSGDRLQSIGLDNWIVTGDNRIDRVAQLARGPLSLPLIETFCSGKKVFIAGSTWPSDLAILAPWLNGLPDDWRFIVAPHQVSERSVAQTEKALAPLPCLRYSRLDEPSGTDARCLIVDNVGMLSSLYALGRIAYIGGGFQASGIHNTLEPAVFGLPILFGPHYRHFREAVRLVERGAAWPVRTTEELAERAHLLFEEARWRQASRQASQFIRENEGATGRVVRFLEEKGWVGAGRQSDN